MEEIKEKNLDPHNFFKKNLGAEDRVDAKAYEEMNLPMTGVPEEDNITILDDKPPLFHNVPEYDIENNPFSFLYVDMTYDCNMECEFCYNPVRNYSTLYIEWFEDVCARLPHPVNFRLLGGEPTLYPHYIEHWTLLQSTVIKQLSLQTDYA